MKTEGWDDAEANKQITKAWVEAAFHCKLKYIYMRGRTGRRLDSKVYFLVEIVLRDLEVSVFVNELKIGRINPQRKDSEVSNNDNLDISSYICNCRNFKSQQLPCKHIFAILNKLHANANSVEDSSHNHLIQQLESLVAEEPNNFFIYIGPPGDKNFEFTKLQEELTSITEEWKEKKVKIFTVYG
ncbi:hypothetical protein C2G38_2215842 [Gigaspora rosea]|uniref:SWIM-type domain-containing protein n=1 Tax=Gigaspora rosea TaxID=44941 RepID=A0A397UCY0_9GLOM|nr:hypothetical protein C2G38_2215842 [Gigaspora rosea]